ncbi:Dipeptide-binding ABC transporter, periplasmic substrate-binding component [Pseudonocardia sp. Ae717_Ps2]|uniref:ABC transporter substrate-binding protein n=1 Tax=Pseudonocardia sp. Ae717_Ps2 TaxID=1885573 RepID=UPI00094ABFBD|nr:ABC transporter substrate-binding protein [Pseudonocardia sp. Ae717_Ps2]OLM30077.1 Dipeptide-binding ABC transporter, periplasmic substrate-binding component [Pseudonocardia sp. Ae717_Ps2]
MPPTTPTDRRQLSRRSLFRGAGALGLGVGLTSLLNACGVASPGGGGGGTAGGTLTVGTDATSGVFDPAFYTTLGDWMVVDSVCRGLTFCDFTDPEPRPELAESWTVSEDGLTYEFALRQGVTFHDGTTFTSADVLASLNRQLNADDPTLPDGASRPFQSLGRNLVSLDAPDERTVRIVLHGPDGTLLARLSDIGARVISKAALDRHGADIGKNLVGTGPFRLTAATAGQSVTLEAFDGFTGGRPPVDRVVMQQVQDSSTMIGSLISGAVSVTQFTPYSAVGQLRANDAVTVHDTPYCYDAMLLMDVRRPALAELGVRRAINLAIDRQAILDQAFFGVGTLPAGYAVPPSMPGHDPSLADLSRTDVAEARRLIEAAGAVGREVRLMAASDTWHPRAAQVIAQNLTDIGLRVVSDSVDPAAFFSRVMDTDDPYHEIIVWERNSYVPDPDNTVGNMAVPRGVYGSSATGFDTLPGTARFTEDTVAARNMPIGPERTAAYSAIQRRWAEDFMVLSMLVHSTNLVVTGASVSGVNVNALSTHRCFLDDASVSGA